MDVRPRTWWGRPHHVGAETCCAVSSRGRTAAMHVQGNQCSFQNIPGQHSFLKDEKSSGRHGKGPQADADKRHTGRTATLNRREQAEEQTLAPCQCSTRRAGPQEAAESPRGTLNPRHTTRNPGRCSKMACTPVSTAGANSCAVQHGRHRVWGTSPRSRAPHGGDSGPTAWGEPGASHNPLPGESTSPPRSPAPAQKDSSMGATAPARGARSSCSVSAVFLSVLQEEKVCGEAGDSRHLERAQCHGAAHLTW